MKFIQPQDRIWLLLILTSGSITILFNNLALLPLVQYLTLPLTTLFIIKFAISILRKTSGNLFGKMVIGALAASFMGDAILQFGHLEKNFFILGVGFFLLAQIIYSLSFWIPNRFHRKDILSFIFFLIFGSAMYLLLEKYIPEIKYLILAYITVICIMGWRAMSCFHQDYFSQKQKILILAGALLFILSDCILSVNLFITPIPFGNLLVLAPYYLAQISFALSVREK